GGVNSRCGQSDPHTAAGRAENPAIHPFPTFASGLIPPGTCGETRQHLFGAWREAWIVGWAATRWWPCAVRARSWRRALRAARARANLCKARRALEDRRARARPRRNPRSAAPPARVAMLPIAVPVVRPACRLRWISLAAWICTLFLTYGRNF